MEVAADGEHAGVTSEPDEVLWRRSLAGDGEAFGTLFDRHRDRVFRHACRVVDSRQDAEDVVASAFLELWRRRVDVRLVDSSVLPWLLATATNLGRNVVRGTRRHRRFLDRLPRSQPSPDSADIALDMHALGVDARISNGLRLLSPKDAQLFALVALEGYPVTVAAEQLGLSESAARSRLRRARGSLQAQFGQSFSAVAPRNEGGVL